MIDECQRGTHCIISKTVECFACFEQMSWKLTITCDNWKNQCGQCRQRFRWLHYLTNDRKIMKSRLLCLCILYFPKSAFFSLRQDLLLLRQDFDLHFLSFIKLGWQFGKSYSREKSKMEHRLVRNTLMSLPSFDI